MIFQRIVVGMDERDISRFGVDAGLALAKRFDARLDFVHCAPAASDGWNAVQSYDWNELRVRYVAGARERASRALRQWLPREHEDREDDLIVLDDRVGHGLAEYAREHAADLIVIGKHERRGVFDFGSTARALLHHAPCGVWTQSGPVRDVERVLVPVDPLEPSREALDHAHGLAATFGARAILFHAFQAPGFSMDPLHAGGSPLPADVLRDVARKHLDDLAAGLGWDDVEVELRFEEVRPAKGILELEEAVDLIVMATHGRGVLGRAVMGSVAYEVLRGAKGAVLAIPMKQRAPAGPADPASSGD